MDTDEYLDWSSMDIDRQRITLSMTPITEKSKHALLRIYGDIIEKEKMCDKMDNDRASPGSNTFGSISTAHPPRVRFALTAFGQL
jgi:hypothetical protein